MKVFQGTLKYLVNNLKQMKARMPDLKFDILLESFKSNARSEIHDGLPPKKCVDHEIEIEQGSEPPCTPLL